MDGDKRQESLWALVSYIQSTRCEVLVVVGAGSGEVLSALWCTALYETPSDHPQVYRTFEVTLYPLGQISFSDSAWILSAQVPILNRFFLLCSYIVHRKHLIHSPRTTEKK